MAWTKPTQIRVGLTSELGWLQTAADTVRTLGTVRPEKLIGQRVVDGSWPSVRKRVTRPICFFLLPSTTSSSS